MSNHAPLSAVGSPLSDEPIHITRYPQKPPECSGHIYSLFSTVPKDYLYWYKPPPSKTLTVTGEHRKSILKKLELSLQQSKLNIGCQFAVELHCSGYFILAMDVFIEIIGSHVHIHNPNIASRIVERYKRFSKQLGFPPKCGTIEFPSQDNIDTFMEKEEVKGLQATINCQGVRNFIAECVSLITLSHQKEMTLPRIKPTDVNVAHLCEGAKKFKVGGTKPERLTVKNELPLALLIIQKCLLFKTPKVEDAIYWIIWISKLESKCKRVGERLPCTKINVSDISKEDSSHWVWHIWKIVFTRLTRMPYFKKKQITDLYFLFKLHFHPSKIEKRLPILFFSIRLLNYDMGNNFPAVINHLNLYIQACANINSLYRNLMIRLARASWTAVCSPKQVEKVEPKPKKMTKKDVKEKETVKKLYTLHEKTAYLDIIPIKQAHTDTQGAVDYDRIGK